ncbi:trans-Golgi network integral membrane protein 2 isoform X2 [Cavia porcellus]|uniref:Trans-golgi network protein 2 n=1 Tax=Cavia porcellus TaxID=10141 RepID=A0A286XRQ9_CAVPO
MRFLVASLLLSVAAAALLPSEQPQLNQSSEDRNQSAALQPSTNNSDCCPSPGIQPSVPKDPHLFSESNQHSGKEEKDGSNVHHQILKPHTEKGETQQNSQKPDLHKSEAPQLREPNPDKLEAEQHLTPEGNKSLLEQQPAQEGSKPISNSPSGNKGTAVEKLPPVSKTEVTVIPDLTAPGPEGEDKYSEAIQDVEPKEAEESDDAEPEEGSPPEEGKEKVSEPASRENREGTPLDSMNKDKDGLNKKNSENPENAESSHFFAYLVTAAILVAVLYIAYHNKRKIIAFALEGKRSKVTRRPKASDYQRLNLKL